MVTFFHHHGKALCVDNNKRSSYFRCQYPLQLSIGKEPREKPYELTFRVHSCQFMGSLSRHTMSTIRVSFHAVKPFLLVSTCTKSVFPFHVGTCRSLTTFPIITSVPEHHFTSRIPGLIRLRTSKAAKLRDDADPVILASYLNAALIALGLYKDA